MSDLVPFLIGIAGGVATAVSGLNARATLLDIDALPQQREAAVSGFVTICVCWLCTLALIAVL